MGNGEVVKLTRHCSEPVGYCLSIARQGKIWSCKDCHSYPTKTWLLTTW